MPACRESLARIKRQYSWPGLGKDVTTYVNNCLTCAKRKAYGSSKAPLKPLPVVAKIWEQIAMDVVGPVTESSSGNKYILVLSDYASRYVITIPMEDQKAHTVAEHLVKKIKTTSYHPQTDGLVERFNRTLCDMLACYVTDEPECWDKYLDFVTFAEPIMPSEMPSNKNIEVFEDDSEEYEKQWQTALERSQNRLAQAQERQKQLYDQGSKLVTYKPNDHVLLRAQPSPGKFNNRWLGPYKINRQISDVNYEILILREDSKDLEDEAKLIVHVNRLKLVSNTPNEQLTVPNKAKVIKRRGRPPKVVHVPKRRGPSLTRKDDKSQPKRRGRPPKIQEIAKVKETIITKAPVKDVEISNQNHVDREENEKVLSKPISYRIATKEDTEFKIEGLVCSQWIETKRITGSFWLGSYDNEYLHTTKEERGNECQVKEYSVVNCLAQEIELRRNRVGGPILSPFGSHNVSLGVDHLIVNHNTIVWIEQNKIVDDCVAKFKFFGTGQLSIIRLGLDSNNQVTRRSNRTGRLIDSTKQIEVLFDTTRKPFCNDHPNSYAVLGIPDTHIVFDENIEKLFMSKQVTKPRQSRQVSQSYFPPRNAFAWGHILPLDPAYLNRGYVVSATNREASSGRLAWKVFAGLALKPRLPSDKDLFQEFEHATDQSLRFVKGGVQYCLNIEQPNPSSGSR
uniref:RNA-directed DNA polymerase n=1 Tax=Daphnia galeata TaxID=27404 RepID=A0A8J2RHT0_9CRUS|nr:unnamed protein product [Daphnia galeata]